MSGKLPLLQLLAEADEGPPGSAEDEVADWVKGFVDGRSPQPLDTPDIDVAKRTLKMLRQKADDMKNGRLTFSTDRYNKTFGKEIDEFDKGMRRMRLKQVIAAVAQARENAKAPGYVKTAGMSRDRIQAQYARHPQSSLDVLSKRLAKTKWGKRDVAREDAAHAEEFGITGEDKEYLDRYIIARIAEHHDRKAKCKQAIMRALWEKSHNGESFDAALPARMARFRQYEDSPFGNYSNPIEQKKWEEWRDKPEDVFSKDWENYLKS